MSRRHTILAAAGIIAVLLGLTLPAVQHARTSAQRAGAASQIAQLDAGIAAFKAKYRVEFIPCCGGDASGKFRLASAMPADWPETRYLRQLFPQMDLSDNGLRVDGMPAPAASPLLLDCNQCLAFFLSHFSTDPRHPLAGIDPMRRILDPWGTPYAYFAWSPEFGNYPPAASLTWGETTAVPLFTVDGMLNPRRWQIISAGPDRRFGVYPHETTTAAGLWRPGAGDWRDGGPGADDVSNFNVGPLLSRQ